MKRILAVAAVALALSFNAVAQTSVIQSLQNINNRTPSFIAATGNFTLDATPTEACLLTGSATKTVYVKRISFSGLKDTAGALLNVTVVKRTTAASGGTAVAATEVAFDSQDTPTAAASHYTGDPTPGTGTVIWSNKYYFALATEGAGGHVNVDFGGDQSKYLVLRGVAQAVAINLAGQTISGGTFACHFEWMEY